MAIGLATLPAQVLHTPDTLREASVYSSLRIQHLLLAGDTLFAGRSGEPIFPGAMGGRSCARS